MASATHYHFDLGLDEDYTFSDPDISGGPQVAYGDRVYTGAELDIVRSEIGTIVTIVTELIADKHIRRLTVLIPPVQFSGASGGAYVTSQAIISTQHMRFGGSDAVTGQAISYESRFVAGAASVGIHS